MFDITLLDGPTDGATTANPSAFTGLVSVCCNCDRVRSRSGKWGEDHTPTPGERRTHGICPDCFAILYPEYASPGSRR
jgi:hypothetical protein